MENQITRTLNAKLVIQDFKTKEINLKEDETERYIELVYFFAEQAFKFYNSNETCNPQKFQSIEPKKRYTNYNLLINSVLLNKF